jgi:hypothetical protein
MYIHCVDDLFASFIDESLVPFDHLQLQSTLYFDLPEKTSLVPYIQLICYSENYLVEPSDIAYLCELFQYDIRCIIDTLQFWLNETLEHDEHFVYQYLFAHVMGFADLLSRPSADNNLQLMDRIKGSDHRIQDLCKQYYFEKILDHKQEKEEVMGIEDIYKVMETAAFADAWVGLTYKQRHQVSEKDFFF